MSTIRVAPAVTALLMLTSLAAPLAAQAPVAGDTPVITPQGDAYVLRVDQEDGTPLIDLLALFEKLLGVPIAYPEEAVSGVRVRLLGALTVPRDGMRQLLDTLIHPYGLVSWDAAPGDEALITIAPTGHASRGRTGVARRWGRQVVRLAELDGEPERTTALYTTVFPLVHVDARAALSSLNPFLDTDGEMIRSVEGSNSVIVTAFSMETLREIRDLIALIDVESIAVDGATTLEQRVAALEAKLAALEDALEGMAGPGEDR